MPERDTQPSPPEIRPRPIPPQIHARPQVEERSASKVLLEFANDARHGAGWTAGAVGVAGAVGAAKKVKQTLSGNEKPKKK